MTQAKYIKALEDNKNKKTARDQIKQEVLSLGKRYTTGLTLCGKSCLLENELAKEQPNSKIYCIEQNPETFKIAKSKLAKQHSIVLGSWFQESRKLIKQGKKIHWIWADFCSIPRGTLVYGFCHQVATLSPKLFAVTFSLRGRHEKGGAKVLSKSYAKAFGIDAKKFLSGPDGLGQVAIKALTETLGYYPKKVIRYNGGDGGKCPMITIVFIKDSKLSADTNSYNFMSNSQRGYSITELCVIGGVKKLCSKTQAEKNPVMVEAGKKAWVTRRKNQAVKCKK